MGKFDRVALVMRVRSFLVATVLGIGLTLLWSCDDGGEKDEGEITSCASGLLDRSSGLCWQDPPLAEGHDWESAVDYCGSLDLGGYGPGSWHLPTISELRSLIRGCSATETGGSCDVTDSCLDYGECYNVSCHGCSDMNGSGTGGTYWPAGYSDWYGDWYWSSSSRIDDLSFAWSVSFRDAGVGYDDKTLSASVRCVRPGS